MTHLITERSVEFIKAKAGGEGQPFFLYVPFTAVHLPLKEPEEWLNRVPEEITGEVPRQYAACVMHLDDAVGQIVDAVEKAGKKDNTLIIFTSDNGGSTAENNDTKYPDDHCPNGLPDRMAYSSWMFPNLPSVPLNLRPRLRGISSAVRWKPYPVKRT